MKLGLGLKLGSGWPALGALTLRPVRRRTIEVGSVRPQRIEATSMHGDRPHGLRHTLRTRAGGGPACGGEAEELRLVVVLVDQARGVASRVAADEVDAVEGHLDQSVQGRARPRGLAPGQGEGQG